MCKNKNEYTIEIIGGISNVSASQWNSCAGKENPFVSFEFLSALEDSGSVSAETGWLPQHILIKDNKGLVVAAAPAYIKSHSYGEYVFDWGWADAFERAGGKYYPKLQVAVPFSPVTGPRLLIRPGGNADELFTVCTKALKGLAHSRGASSIHITFCTSGESQVLDLKGFLKRTGAQFHWHNQGYTNFDDFLAVLNSRKRKTIRKERLLANSEVSFQVLSGVELKKEHMDSFYGFYLNTVDRKWAHAYLKPQFFSMLRDRMSEKIVLIFAKHDGAAVGAALNILGTDTLYGRNWGCTERYKMLYFEACFYRAIEFAIENKLKKVEAGAQGPHKISRGYLPTETYSAHWIENPNLRDAVASFLTKERRQNKFDIEYLKNKMSPYRKNEEK